MSKQKIDDLSRLLEIFALAIIGFAYWYATPIRDQWIGLIGLLSPIYWVKYKNSNETFINSLRFVLIYMPLGALLLLCLVNIPFSPFESRGIILIFRPLYGVTLVLFASHYIYQYLHPVHLLHVTVVMGLSLGIIAITATNWQTIGGKLGLFTEIVSKLPVIHSYPDASGLFNPNEIAGGITWLAPLVLGLLFIYRRASTWLWMGLAGAATLLLYLALVLGLSLSGLTGALGGSVLVIFAQLERRIEPQNNGSVKQFRLLKHLWLKVTAASIAVIIVVQALILIHPPWITQTLMAIIQRTDSQSLLHREVIWTSARQAVLDYPMTGIGMAVYRSPAAWQAYPTPGFNRQDAVHAHNELLHIGTDLGVPGMIVLTAIYSTAGYMLWYSYRYGSLEIQGYATAVSAGMVAHMIYGLADAIPLWDRFAFLFWWMLALSAALYIHTRQQVQSDSRDSPM